MKDFEIDDEVQFLLGTINDQRESCMATVVQIDESDNTFRVLIEGVGGTVATVWFDQPSSFDAPYLLKRDPTYPRLVKAAKDTQPAPEPNDSTPIWELVIADMHERDGVGRERYGTPLQAHNGRDALRDAYEEALDLAVYLRQAIEGREDDG